MSLQKKLYSVVIPAAGIGSRMAADKAKQYLSISNKTILEHTLDIFLSHPNIAHIVVVLHPDDTIFATLNIKSTRIHAVIGGNERVNSVLAGLRYIAKNIAISAIDEPVLVHDAARPCLTHHDLNKLLSDTPANMGGILAIPVADTLKQAQTGSNNIARTIDRRLLWQAQTPQMFPLRILIEAINKSLSDGAAITDEASAMEHCMHPVALIEGQSSNIKITRPSDLPLAQYYLSMRDNISHSKT